MHHVLRILQLKIIKSSVGLLDSASNSVDIFWKLYANRHT